MLDKAFSKVVQLGGKLGVHNLPRNSVPGKHLILLVRILKKFILRVSVSFGSNWKQTLTQRYECK